MTQNNLGPISSRALIYRNHGKPGLVVTAETYQVPAVPKGYARVKFIYAPVNPADNLAILGPYPLKPRVRAASDRADFSVIGNEGVAVVDAVHEEDTNSLKVGQRVVPGAVQLGTWQQYENIRISELIPITNDNFSDERVATLMLNPSTAYRMITDYAPVRTTPNSWLIQNGGNSTVGRNVIQLGKHWGIGTINCVRDRPEKDMDALRSELQALGADMVISYSDLKKPEILDEIKGKTQGKLLLGINCVGGEETTDMSNLIDGGGALVTYGAMSREPLKFSPAIFTFKGVRAVGHWQSKWVDTHPYDDNKKLSDELVELASAGIIETPPTTVLDLSQASDDAQATKLVQDAFNAPPKQNAPKVLLKL